MENEMKNDSHENFGDDPEQNLQIENELLKLKMQAERGAFFGGNMEGLPPEVEAEFLKNVQSFEDSFDKAKQVTIYECIGSPEYKQAEELKPEEIEAEMRKIIELMQSKNIILEVLGKYDLSLIYKFITDELFQEKIKEVDYPEYLHSFVYEDFHPSHDVDIAMTAQDFLDHWVKKEFDENSFELAGQLVTADGKTFSRNEVIARLRNCLNSYREFSNIGFMGCDTNHEWNETEGKGMGHAEGMFRYDAEIENGETIHFEDAFKLYMINEDGYWRIFYFVFPGFSW